MKLTERERIVLACVHLNADLSYGELATETGFREHVVRHCLDKFKRDGVISPYFVINPQSFGLIEFRVLFSLGQGARKNWKRLLAFLINSSCVIWMSELAGDFDFSIVICVRRISELSDFLDSLGRTFGSVFLEKSFASRVSSDYFRRKYLCSKAFLPEKISLTSQHAEFNPDATDRKVLTVISEHPTLSFQEMGRRTGIPLSTLQNRMKKLRQSGVIAGHVYAVDTRKIEMQMFSLLVNVNGLNPKFRENLSDFCRSCPFVTYVTRWIGNFDFEIGIEVSRAENASAIKSALQAAFESDIQSVKVIARFETLKMVRYPFGTAVAAD